MLELDAIHLATALLWKEMAALELERANDRMPGGAVLLKAGRSFST